MPDVPGGWHPALLHMLDVAAVALELMEGGLGRASRNALLSPGPGCRLEPADVAFFVACHDLGKLTPGFQAKVPARADVLVESGLDFPPAGRACTDHALATTDLLPDLLDALGVDWSAALSVAAAVGAHHGRVHQSDDTRAAQKMTYGDDPWRLLRAEALPQLAAALGATPSRLHSEPSDAWTMELAGLTVVSDWIGSDASRFPYRPGHAPSPDYVLASRRAAASALEDLGWRGWAARPEPPAWEQVFPDFQPTPMQRLVADLVKELDRPGLVIVEAATGSGKTETALFAAEHQIARFGLSGLYVALPTQATSNQMFGRLREFLHRRYPEEQVNLHLLHGLAQLHEGYQELRRPEPVSVDGPGRGGAVVADAWFQGKRLGLLSPFAVGTVDQAMLAALQSKFFQLRVLGLAHEVVVIDEVHAYDAFMSGILERLLMWLSAMGSSVVLLSATLPTERRDALVRAFGAEPSAQTAAFPRVTVAAAGSQAASRPVVPRPPDRTVTLAWCEDTPDAVLAELSHALADGGCGAWICNTVGAAQDAYRAALAAGWPADELLLFHARFPVEDRLAIERRVLGSLDKRAARPKRLLLIATQVVEQSLDLDLDVMASQLAPVDLLIQRAGRLHRHAARDPERPPGLRTPRLVLACSATPDAPLEFGPSGYVYHPHILLRTWLTLRGRTSWAIPSESDALMAAVYDLDAAPPSELTAAESEAWRATADALAEDLRASRANGSKHLVPAPSAPGSEDVFLDRLTRALEDPDANPNLHRDFLARTRDIDRSVTLVCLHATAVDTAPQVSPGDPTPVPLDAGRPSRALAAKLQRRSLSIQRRDWLDRLCSDDATAPASWADVAALRHCRAVVFGPDGLAHFGDYTLLLDPDLGLLFDAPETHS